MQKQIQLQTADRVSSQIHSVSERSYHASAQGDLEFLRDWEDGHFPDLCCCLRVRQIRKGNPILVAQQFLGAKDLVNSRPSAVISTRVSTCDTI